MYCNCVTYVTYQRKALKTTQTAAWHRASSYSEKWSIFRNPSSPSSLPTFLSLKPTIAAIHLCRWKVTAEEPRPLLSKPKRSGEAHGRPSPESARGPSTRSPHTHTRGPLQTTQRQAGKRTMGCSRGEDNRGVNARALVCYSPHPSVFTWATDERIGATCPREGGTIMWAALALLSFLSMSEVVEVTYLSGPNVTKPVTFLLWDITCGSMTSWAIGDAMLNAVQTMFMQYIQWDICFCSKIVTCRNQT